MGTPSIVKIIFGLSLISLIAQGIVASPVNVQIVPYTAEEYENYQRAISADPATRADDIIAFMKEDLESALVEYALGSYIQLMQDFLNQGDMQKVFTAGENLLALKPGEPNSLYMTTVAAYNLRNFQKTVEYGEQSYAHKPGTGLAFVLGNSYLQLKNEEKVIEHGEKACSELPRKDCYQILNELMQIYARRANLSKLASDWGVAAKHAGSAIEGWDAAGKPDQMSEDAWKKVVGIQKAMAYQIQGRQAYETNKWTAAISNYQKVLALNPEPPLVAEAYYYMGQGRWRQKQADPAMEAFARGSVQRGAPHAKPCRQYLEQLYRSTHNDSLAGIEEFVERVAP